MSNNPTHVVTDKVRLSFVHLFTPYANNPGEEPKYSAKVLLPKSDFATKQRIDVAIAAAIQSGISSKWNGARPPVLAIPVYDGDGPRPSDGMPYEDECKGHWVFTISSKQPPQIVDAGLNPIINQSEIYSGIYARVSIDFYPYNSNGKKGIGCGLGNVQKIEDGVPLAGGSSASEDFGAPTGVYVPPTASAQYPQQQYAPPVQQPYQQPQYQPPVQPPYQQPQYQQPQAPQYSPPAAQAPYQQPVQPQYAPPVQQQYQQPGYPQQQTQLDPITGQPIIPVMGLEGDLPF